MVNRKGRELRKQVERAMRKEGARNFSLSTTGTCHQRLDFTVDGVEGHFTFASTPGGTRETLNACAAACRAVRRTREKGLEASNSLEEVHSRWRAEPGSKLAVLHTRRPTGPLTSTGSSAAGPAQRFTTSWLIG